MNRSTNRTGIFFICYFSAAIVTGVAVANDNVNITFHRHLHQPIYWGEPDNLRPSQIQFAADSQRRKDAGQNYYGNVLQNPENTLVDGENSVFGKNDRKGAYQGQVRSSISGMTGADAGMSVSYSGSLMRNIWSFGRNNAYGYSSSWNSDTTTAHSWKTRGGTGVPRADMLGMTYHHALSPLLPKSVLRKEIAMQRERQWKSWGLNPNMSDQSRGFWPVEIAFSESIIPVLREFNYDWVLVPNSHLARTCPNYMDVIQASGSGAELKADPPNPADQNGPTVPAGQWYGANRDTFGNVFPLPFAYQAHKAKYVDPTTGVESKITIVPADDYHGYESGYAPPSWSYLDGKITQYNDTSHPSIVVMAADGDNNWGGGNSFWNETAPQMMNDAPNHGNKNATTIQQFLNDHPAPDSDVVHVEDGSWINADQGSPQFFRWLEPPRRLSGVNPNDPFTFFDLENGWHSDMRNWAVMLAGVNYCETAEQITGPANVQPWRIEEPYQDNGTWNNPNSAELAWHFLLWGFDSGFVYYGTDLDDEVKHTFAANRAASLAAPVIGDGSQDQTPPTVFKPQRFPWNPGGKGKGQYLGGQTVGFGNSLVWPSDFYIWTMVFDVSGTTNVTLKVRVDADGQNPVADNANETYAGGAGVGTWVSIPMTKRVMTKTNPTSDSSINFFVLPTYIADYYWVKVTGYRNQLLDYFIEATDSKGNPVKTDIQHVWVGDDGTAPAAPAVPANVTATALATNRIDVGWSASVGATLYYVSRDGNPAGTTAGTSYTDTGLATGTQHCYSVIASNTAGASAGNAPVCATTFTPAPPNNSLPFVIDGVSVDSTNYLQSNPGMTIYAAVRGPMLYVATWSPGTNGANDHFIIVTDQLTTMQPAFPAWNKVGQNAVASTKPFLGAESSNGYIGWQNTIASNQCAKAPTNAGIMEGVINLAEAFGSIPSTIYICSAAYTTTNGGALVAQAPAGNGNGNIESNEFMAIPVAALLDNDANGVYDRLEPTLDFTCNIQSNYVVNWACVPGKQYQVVYCDALGGAWSNSSTVVTAGIGQVNLSFPDLSATNAPQRFYKVKLLP